MPLWSVKYLLELLVVFFNKLHGYDITRDVVPMSLGYNFCVHGCRMLSKRVQATMQGKSGCHVCVFL